MSREAELSTAQGMLLAAMLGAAMWALAAQVSGWLG